MKIQQAFPFAHVHKVCAAALLMIGSDDLRVAPKQGIEYYHALKGRKNSALGLGGPGTTDHGEVELLIFEGENHLLGGVEAGRVVWEAARVFLASIDLCRRYYDTATCVASSDLQARLGLKAAA